MPLLRRRKQKGGGGGDEGPDRESRRERPAGNSVLIWRQPPSIGSEVDGQVRKTGGSGGGQRRDARGELEKKTVSSIGKKSKAGKAPKSYGVALIYLPILVVLAGLLYQTSSPVAWIASIDWCTLLANMGTLLSSMDWGNALAALLAVGGYLFEQWSSRKTTRLEKQIDRVVAQSSEFLVPITTQFHSLFICSTLYFIDRNMGEVIVSAEDEATDDLESISDILLKRFPGADAPHLENPTSFALLMEVMFDKSKTEQGLIANTASKTELPKLLHGAVAKCDRSSLLWKRYEAWVRNEIVPAVEEIERIITEHSHLMVPVPVKRLEELFGSNGPGYSQPWTHMPRMWFYSKWLSYARSWRTVLSLWDEGQYCLIRPTCDFPVGLLFFNVEAQTIAGKVEKDLIGVSQMHGHVG